MTTKNLAIVAAAGLAAACVTYANRTKLGPLLLGQPAAATQVAAGEPAAANIGQSTAGEPAAVAATQPAAMQNATWSAQQLDNLVTPVALYPDALLSQVLVACTFPQQVIAAKLWLNQNRALTGAALIDAARQQNWDASVEALLPFPRVVARLNGNAAWMTELGQAFQAQQAGVMDAIQRMRERAREAGKLNTTSQWTVSIEVQDAASVIEIQAADPNILYVPVYDPVCVWGVPAWGAYPVLVYSGCGLAFEPAVAMNVYFAGWSGWAAWGWYPRWFAHGVFVNPDFCVHYGFHSHFVGGITAGGGWAHAGHYGPAASFGSHGWAGHSAAVGGPRWEAGGFGGHSMSQGASSMGRTASLGRSGSGSGGSAFRSGQTSSFRSAPASGFRSSSTSGYRSGSTSGFRSTPSYTAANRSYSAPRSSAGGTGRSFGSGGFRSSGMRAGGFSGGGRRR